MRSDIKRILLAAIVSPLVILIIVPAGALAVSLTFGKPVETMIILEVAGLLLCLGYLTMLVFGVPAYLLLRRLNLASFWNAAGVGYLSGILMEMVVRDSRIHVFMGPQFQNPIFLVGAVVGAAFWLIAKPRPGIEEITP